MHISLFDFLADRLRTVHMALFSAFIIMVLLLASYDLRAEEIAPLSNCIMVAGLESIKNPQEVEFVETRKKGDPIRKDLLRPMNEKELILMISAMEPVKTKEEGWAIRALAEGSKLDLDRIGVVMGDAINLLSVIQTKEMLDRLKKAPGIAKKDLKRMEKAFKAMEMCGQMRFDDWGGKRAFQESIKIVEGHRPELEILLSKAWERGVLPRIGGRP